MHIKLNSEYVSDKISNKILQNFLLSNFFIFIPLHFYLHIAQSSTVLTPAIIVILQQYLYNIKYMRQVIGDVSLSDADADLSVSSIKI